MLLNWKSAKCGLCKRILTASRQNLITPFCWMFRRNKKRMGNRGNYHNPSHYNHNVFDLDEMHF